MKVYNIDNGKAFFEKLAGCEGRVEMVGENGKRLLLTEGRQEQELILMTYFNGGIRELELIFQKQEDLSRILSYLMNKRGLAA